MCVCFVSCYPPPSHTHTHDKRHSHTIKNKKKLQMAMMQHMMLMTNMMNPMNAMNIGMNAMNPIGMNHMNQFGMNQIGMDQFGTRTGLRQSRHRSADEIASSDESYDPDDTRHRPAQSARTEQGKAKGKSSMNADADVFLPCTSKSQPQRRPPQPKVGPQQPPHPPSPAVVRRARGTAGGSRPRGSADEQEPDDEESSVKDEPEQSPGVEVLDDREPGDIGLEGIKTIEIYSFGLERLHIDPHVNFDKAMEFMPGKFHHRYHWIGEEINMWVDARMFHSCKELCPSGHSGEHDECIKQVIEHGYFGRWLSDVKDRFMTTDPEETGPHMKIAVACRAGTNRSVSAARIFTEILKESHFIVGAPVHLSQHEWGRKGMCSGNCSNCKPNAAKKEHFRKAIEMWRAFK